MKNEKKVDEDDFSYTIRWRIPLIFTLILMISLSSNQDKKIPNNPKQETTITKKDTEDTEEKDINIKNKSSIIKAAISKDSLKKKDKKEKKTKFKIKNLSIINTNLISKDIKQKYYLVKIKKKDSSAHKNKSCPYKNKDNTKMICLSTTYINTDPKKTATFTKEVHYSNYLKKESYLCMKANINGKKYKRIYTLTPGTIDHNPNNRKKFNQFEHTISTLSSFLNLDPDNQKKLYTAQDIKKLSKNPPLKEVVFL